MSRTGGMEEERSRDKTKEKNMNMFINGTLAMIWI